jgi:microcin C transport system substrate-binding protein
MNKQSVFALSIASIILLSSCTGSEGYGKKNELHVNIGGEPSTINPITATDGYAQNVKSYIVDSLLTQDPETLEWKPQAAESWKISPDGMTFTFKLRPGLVFSDGSPLTSADVKATFDAYFDPEYNAISIRPYYSLIEKVETPDPLTVVFKVKEKYFENFDFAAGIGILPAKYYKNAKEGKKINLNIYGSGPYKLESFERGKKIVLTKNPLYWGFKNGNPTKEFNFDKIHLYFVTDDVVTLENFKKGRFDVMEPPIQPEIFEIKMVGPEWGKKLIKVKADNHSVKGYSYVAWNLSDPKFSDKRVRRALNYLMNREMMLQKFFYGMYDAANGPVATTGDDNDHSVPPIPFDVAKAKALFKEAGWTDSDKNGILDKTINGKKINMSFTILIATDAWQKWLTIYKEDAARAGVDVNIQLLEWNSFLKNLDEGKFEAVAMAWGGGSHDFDFKQIWHSESAQKGGSNRSGYKNAEVDKLIEQHRRILDRNKRLELSHKIFRLIADDSPYLWMFSRRLDLYTHNARIWKPKDSFKYTIGTSYWKVNE